MTRAFLRLVTRATLVMLLLAQWSIMSHACTLTGTDWVASNPAAVMADAVDEMASAPEAASLVDCASMDGMSAHTQDPVCAEHCALGDQGDRNTALVVPTAILSVAYFLETSPATGSLRRPSMATSHALVLGSPPHAILHCVRRT